MDVNDIFEPTLDGANFSTIPTENTILNRLKAKSGEENNVYIEELQIPSANITPTGCVLKPKPNSYHYKQGKQISYTYPAPYQFKINDFFPNIDKNIQAVDATLPTVCPDVISAYDLSMNYHDIPYTGNITTQQNHFYWDDTRFTPNLSGTYYESGINDLWIALESLKVTVGTSDIKFNRNQVEPIIPADITNNFSTEPVDQKYKVKLRTKANSTFYVPNTTFYIYICRDVYTPIPAATAATFLSTKSNFDGSTKHYYLTADVSMNNTSGNNQEIACLEFGGVLDGRRKTITSANADNATKNWDDNGVLFSGKSGNNQPYFRNLILPLNVNICNYTATGGGTPSGRNTVFQNANVENVLLNVTKITSYSSYGAGILAGHHSYGSGANQKWKWTKLYLQANFDCIYTTNPGVNTGIFFGQSRWDMGGNVLTIKDISTRVNYQGIGTGIVDVEKKYRWFGSLSVNDNPLPTPPVTKNEINIKGVVDDLYNCNTFKTRYKNSITDFLGVKAESYVDVTNQTKKPSDYTRLENFQANWYIPTNNDINIGQNEAIPQRSWVCNPF